MKKWLLLAFLILIIACNTQTVEEKKAKQQVKNLYNSQKVDSQKVKEIIDELLLNKKEEKKTENKEENSIVEELPRHPCAMFDEKDSVKFCNMPYVASKFSEFELHNTCKQQFRSKGLPYDYLNIKSLTYPNREEAKKKFEIDYGAYQGIYDKKNKNLFWKENEKIRMAEFVLGKKVVRISESKKGVCEKFEDLVKVAFAKGG